MKKSLLMVLCLSILLENICNVYFCKFLNVFAYVDETATFNIYDEDNFLIAQRYYVEEGDIVINNNFDEYKVYFVDYGNKKCFAKKTAYYDEPKIVKKDSGLRLISPTDKSVGLYMTHNDESFEPTDGYSSVYGKGGIHDVARRLKEEFEDIGYQVFFDESLHLPHDSKAYSRSVETAKRLLGNDVDALFDIHRDGVSRSVYVKNVDGIERCKIRIVVGQANPNKEANLQFAMYLLSVAKEYCPWLFLDIYYAKGHYNQELTSKGLLFECGTYLAEKEIVLKSIPYLAMVVDKTLFSTVVEDEDQLVIKDEAEAVRDENNVNNILEKIDESVGENNEKKNNQQGLLVVVGFVLIVFCFFGLFNKKRIVKRN